MTRSWRSRLSRRVDAVLRAARRSARRVTDRGAQQGRRGVPSGDDPAAPEGPKPAAPERTQPAAPEGGWAALTRSLLELAAQPERAPLPAEQIQDLVRAAGSDADGAPSAPGRPGRSETLTTALTVARRLVRQQRHAAARELVDLLVGRLDPPPSSGLQAVGHHARLSLGAEPGPQLGSLADAALAGADAALGSGDLPRAAELLDVGAGLMLHRDLHADPATSPLVEDPKTFLEPFRRSRAMAALAAPPAGAEPEAGSEPVSRAAVPAGTGRVDTDPRPVVTAASPPRIVVLTGAYPRFSRPLVEALRGQGHHVDVIDLADDHRPFRWIGTDPEQVLHRLRASVEGDGGGPDRSWGYGVPEQHLWAVRQADVVIADWADKGAVWASLVTPPQARLVVRVHGVDALSLWVHAVNWARVDAVLAVSAHQAGLVDDVLRWGAVGAQAAPPCRVVHNFVTLPAVSDPPPRDPWALGLVGWAKLVKDPLWALEVLAGLRARGAGPWRLVLVGEDFPAGGGPAVQEYVARFRERKAQPDLAGAVELVGRSEQVEREVARLGFILSSSVRESFHLGLVEGVIGGAVPVVRDWPFFASRRGAGTLFPQNWVVPDVAAAVERIWALRDPAARDVAAHEAGQEVATRFDPARTAAELERLVLGG